MQSLAPLRKCSTMPVIAASLQARAELSLTACSAIATGTRPHMR